MEEYLLECNPVSYGVPPTVQPARKDSWNPASVEPVQWKPVDVNPVSLKWVETRRYLSSELMVQTKQKKVYGVESHIQEAS